jgi:hypothetical protein
MRPLGVQILALGLSHRRGLERDRPTRTRSSTPRSARRSSIADAEKRKTVMGSIDRPPKILQDSGIIIQPFWRAQAPTAHFLLCFFRLMGSAALVEI